MDKLLRTLAARYGYSRRDAVGAAVTALIMLLCVALPPLYERWRLSQPLPALPTGVAMESNVSKAGAAAPSSSSNTAPATHAPTAKAAVRLHPFDPNAATPDELEALGCPAWLARRIDHYRTAGGKFRKAEDLARIYSFPQELYATLAPYVRIAGAEPVHVRPASKTSTYAPTYRTSYTERPARTFPVLDLNLADSAELEALPGIGAYTAHAILRYRSLLGGYVDVRQLYELYNQDSTRTASFLPNLKVAPHPTLSGLNINTPRPYHPYLPKTAAKLVDAFRKQHGAFKTVAELRTYNLVDSATYARLLPYLRVE